MVEKMVGKYLKEYTVYENLAGSHARGFKPFEQYNYPKPG